MSKRNYQSQETPPETMTDNLVNRENGRCEMELRQKMTMRKIRSPYTDRKALAFTYTPRVILALLRVILFCFLSSIILGLNFVGCSYLVSTIAP